MRVLVCGGRDYSDDAKVYQTLSELAPHPTLVIHGFAPGADALADAWALDNFVPVESYAADWRKDGRAAGPKRNQRMLDEGKPDIVVAFPGGKGTADMVRRAKAAGVRVIEVK